jgi:hypothetical protein
MSVGRDLAPSTTPLAEGQYTEIGEPTEGSAWGVMLFAVPISEPGATRRARDRAIEAAGADALVNVSLSSMTYFLPLVSVYQTTVRGTPVDIHD